MRAAQLAARLASGSLLEDDDDMTGNIAAPDVGFSEAAKAKARVRR